MAHLIAELPPAIPVPNASPTALILAAGAVNWVVLAVWAGIKWWKSRMATRRRPSDCGQAVKKELKRVENTMKKAERCDILKQTSEAAAKFKECKEEFQRYISAGFDMLELKAQGRLKREQAAARSESWDVQMDSKLERRETFWGKGIERHSSCLQRLRELEGFFEGCLERSEAARVPFFDWEAPVRNPCFWWEFYSDSGVKTTSSDIKAFEMFETPEDAPQEYRELKKLSQQRKAETLERELTSVADATPIYGSRNVGGERRKTVAECASERAALSIASPSSAAGCRDAAYGSASEAAFTNVAAGPVANARMNDVRQQGGGRGENKRYRVWRPRWARMAQQRRRSGGGVRRCGALWQGSGDEGKRRGTMLRMRSTASAGVALVVPRAHRTLGLALGVNAEGAEDLHVPLCLCRNVLGAQCLWWTIRAGVNRGDMYAEAGFGAPDVQGRKKKEEAERERVQTTKRGHPKDIPHCLSRAVHGRPAPRPEYKVPSSIIQTGFFHSAPLTPPILTSVHIRGSDSCMHPILIGKKGEAPTQLDALHLHLDSLIAFQFALDSGLDFVHKCSIGSNEGRMRMVLLNSTQIDLVHSPQIFNTFACLHRFGLSIQLGVLRPFKPRNSASKHFSVGFLWVFVTRLSTPDRTIPSWNVEATLAYSFRYMSHVTSNT
ncbi:hypothetical protein C8R43DRAFT_954141 [Mycena crocata]|nr:hypothetical protein C8R43DRAFT_954141 [Mycena crocata]